MTQRIAAKTRVSKVAVMGVFMCCCIPAVGGLFRVWVAQDAVQKGYALAKATRTHNDLRERLSQHELEFAALRSPGQLAKFAARLGLEAARPQQVFGEGRHGR